MPDRSRKHSQPVLLRFEPDQLELIDQAAERAGLNRTSWLRATSLRVARQELAKQAGVIGGGRGNRTQARRP